MASSSGDNYGHKKTPAIGALTEEGEGGEDGGVTIEVLREQLHSAQALIQQSKKKEEQLKKENDLLRFVVFFFL